MTSKQRSEIRNAKIRSVQLGFEDHGILTCWLNLDYGGSVQGFGGYGFSHRPRGDKDVGAPDLADYLIGILRTLEVDAWEKLPGTPIRVETNGEGGCALTILRIGHLLKDQWFNPQDVVGKRR